MVCLRIMVIIEDIVVDDVVVYSVSIVRLQYPCGTPAAPLL